MIRRVLRSPLPYLLLALAWSYSQADHLQWLEPRLTNDSNSYIMLADSSSLYEALSGLRTYGYAAVLGLARPLGEEWQWLPEIHFAAYAAALLLYWLALARFTGSRWLAFAASAPLVVSCSLSYLPQVMPDVVGNALALATVALFFLLVRQRRSVGLWIALGVACFLSWLMKPVYVFLVVLIPLLGATLRLAAEPRRPVKPVRFTAALAALTFVPFLAFGALRAAVVGQFGVGGLGGYNLLGVASNFLSDELVEQIPDEEQQWLAREILKGRKMRKWTPMQLNSWIHWYQQQHTPNIFRIAEPKATQLILHRRGGPAAGADADPMDVPGVMGESALAIDREMAALGKEIIRHRPLLYLRWITEGVRTGFATVFDCAWDKLLFGLLFLTFALAAVRVVRDPGALAALPPERLALLVGIGLVAVIFFLGNLGVVVLVHFLKARYAAAAVLLLPSLLGAALFESFRVIAAPRSGRRSAR